MYLAVPAVLASLVLAPQAVAQTAGGNTSSAPAPAATTTTQEATHAKAGKNGSVSSADRKFMEKAAIGGLAEVQMGQLAKDRGMSDEVKSFGTQMVNDHGKANDELKSLAAAKGVALPAETDKSHQKKMDKLAKLSGPDFDRAYMKDMVKDHKKDVSEFRKEAKKAKDPDVQKFAQATLPTLEEHLTMAEKTSDVVQGSKRTGNRETGSTKP
jgi:putative membrane protein